MYFRGTEEIVDDPVKTGNGIDFLDIDTDLVINTDSAGKNIPGMGEIELDPGLGKEWFACRAVV